MPIIGILSYILFFKIIALISDLFISSLHLLNK